MGWDPDAHFLVPDGVYERVQRRRARRARRRPSGSERFDAWRGDDAELARRSGTPRGGPGRPLPGLADALPSFDWGKDKLATRARRPEGDGRVRRLRADDGRRRRRPLRVDEDRVPRRRRGALRRATPRGRNVFFGVREHGMGGAVNGMAAHGGIVRPYGSTFLQFADYMRGSIRLSALTGLRRRLGLHARLGRPRRGRPDAPAGRAPRRAARDPGPRRAAPRRRATRPPTAWRVILEDLEGPARLVALAPGPARRSPTTAIDGVGRRAPTSLRDADDAAGASLVGTGSEVGVALAAADARRPTASARASSRCRAGSCSPQQDDAYRDVGPAARTLPKVSVEAGVAHGLGRAGSTRSVSIDRFGASAPGRRGAREARHHRRARRAGAKACCAADSRAQRARLAGRR